MPTKPSRREFLAGAGAFGATAFTGPARAQPIPAQPIPDVIILGAGMSGLGAAYLLEQQGAKVLLLEARKRAGGRVYTLFDQPGYPEMGFNSMAPGYGRGIDTAKRVGVELVNLMPRMVKTAKMEMVFDGKIMTRAEWAASPRNPFPAGEKQTMPWEMVTKTLAQKNPLKDWADWSDPKSAALDISLHDFLAAQGLNEAAIDVSYNNSPYYGDNAYDVSAIMSEFNTGWSALVAQDGKASYGVKGGNQNLPNAMAHQLKSPLLFGKEAVSITTDETGVDVLCRDGSRYRAKRVICSLPFSVLRLIRIDPVLEGRQARAVQTLGYQAITNIFVRADKPFWEKDGLSPSMWTNGPLGNVIAQRFGQNEDEITGLLIQGRGQLARAWDRLGKEGAMRMVVAEIEKIRPAAKGVVHAAAMQSWAMDPFNGGDWAVFHPGQIADFATAMAQPAGRLHFCGEHTASGSRGVEGALESAERVTIEVASAL